MRRVAALLPLLLATLCSGYSSVALAPRLHSVRPAAAAQRLGNPVAVVIDISSTEEFNDAVASAGDSLVVIDYSTSWCGPCKIIAPKYDEFSEKYKNVAFLKVGLLKGEDQPRLPVNRRTRSPAKPHAHRSWATAAQPPTN